MENSSFSAKLLPIGLMAAAGAVFYIALTTPEESAMTEKQKNEHLEKVDHNLKFANKKSNLNSQKIYYDNIRSAPTLNESRPNESVNLSGSSVAIESDINDEVVAERLNPSNKYAPHHSYEQQLRDQISIQEQNREQNEAYQKEYARQFVENAQKGGYNVKLSEDYKIIDVKKIRKPNSIAAPTAPNAKDGGLQ